MCENGNDTYDNCTTRFYQEQMRQNCGCLPYSVIEHNEACINISINFERYILMNKLLPLFFDVIKLFYLKFDNIQGI